MIIRSPFRSPLFLVSITVLIPLPTGFSSFVANDFMQWATIKGSPELQGLGFTKADPDKRFSIKLLDAFRFFSLRKNTNRAYRDYLWASNNASMVPFRSGAVFPHWFDCTVFGGNLVLHW